MINESTKNVKGGKQQQQQPPYAHEESADTVVSVTPTSAKASAVSAAVQLPGLLRQEPQRSSSRDSLGSLQQLVDRGDEDCSGCDKPYIDEDWSSYGVSPPVRSPSSNSCTTTTNYLRPRMQFTGYQISGYKKYQVVINLKTVGLPTCGVTSASPHITGFLTIRGLTNQHPEITTYFEAFAVTHRELGFLSSSWSKDSVLNSCRADDQTDLEHWLNFPAFKELFLHGSKDGAPTLNDVIDGTCEFDNYLEQRFVFMRWKEKYLVPEDLSDGVEGASYDGFYYIVHDQVTGNVQGFYYHKDAEKFQQLELVPSSETAVECSSCDFEMA
ncbi:hypothetical protein ZYGR_0I06840 [Zygosaccharomyces rouxii]|uniref:ZYRO0C16192p n=2 Tax=Zygosaccharomyces rouxii TaxID=4956 RepID=C5DUE9_ZYGRC|nr:uncharacterized protein ZYRO0C16192g [Zygosaccharomyces rouxii]KAH9201419.1 vacuolar import and degradation protein-domain-containing protein [Zygosaccharomyces rouxii]GAV48387.1 hypothetical protein ZYGR_0I06840 [Zygosaccharomyces rouxii]CAR27410.1 ZYRO0C16192p [Zygosaccharomyces rouxii]